MISQDPLFIDEKIDYAMRHYQAKLDPRRELLNDLFIGKLKEMSQMFEAIISSADPNLVAT